MSYRRFAGKAGAGGFTSEDRFYRAKFRGNYTFITIPR